MLLCLVASFEEQKKDVAKQITVSISYNMLY